MARKIPVLVDEEVYYALQEQRVSAADDLNAVIARLLCNSTTQRPQKQYAKALKRHTLIAEALAGLAPPSLKLTGTHS